MAHLSLLVCLLVFLFSFSSFAVEPVRVIHVQTTASSSHEKSLATALLFSLTAPGAGEAYLDENKRAMAFLWTEAVLWTSFYVSWKAGERHLSSAQAYAVLHADAPNAPRDADFLDLMGRYRSRGGVDGMNSSPDGDEDYNQFMLRQGRDVEEEYPSAYSWNWGPTENPENTTRMEEYQDLLKDYRLSRIHLQAFVGLLFLNRIFSLVDVLRIHRSGASGSGPSMSLGSDPLRGGASAQLRIPF